MIDTSKTIMTMDVRNPTILRKFHLFQWSFNVSCRAAGPISRTLGANGFVPAHVVLTSSPVVLLAPSMYSILTVLGTLTFLGTNTISDCNSHLIGSIY